MSRHLFLTADYPPRPGGQARYLEDLWGGRRREEATILAPRCAGAAIDGAEEGPGIVRIPVPLGGSRTARIIRTALFAVFAAVHARREGVESVHAGQVIATGAAAWLCRKIYSLPYTLVVHGADLLEFARHPLAGRLIRAILADAGRVIANSRFTAAEVARYGARPSRIRIVNPVVDASRFRRQGEAAASRRRLGLDGKKVLLTVGRLVRRKGHDTVIGALPRTAMSFHDVHYLVVGDGPDRHRLEELSRRLGCEDRVTFLGHVAEAELPACYAASDLFVMPSREIPEQGDVEGFGIVFLEASAAGRAVVAARCGGIPDAVEDGVSGLLVPPGDAGALADALVRLLRDDELRFRLAEDGRRRVRQRFSRERGRAAFSEVLDELVRAS